MLTPPPPPSQEDTLAALLGSSQRDAMPLRYVFAQQSGETDELVPAPLARIVRRGVASALEQYLLLHARAAGREDRDSGEMHYDVALESGVWARALGLPNDESGRRTVQRNWKALAELGLVRIERSGRLLAVTLLHEDGSGSPYTHPGATRDGRYIKLPYSYWLDGYSSQLKLPGKALLLIALMLPDWFSLPFNKGPEGLVFVPKGMPLEGTLLAFSERGLDAAGNLIAFLIGGARPAAPQSPRRAR